MYFHYGVDGVQGFTYNNQEYTYQKNIFGDIIAIFDNNGQKIAKYAYDAWGNCKTYVLNDGTFVDTNAQLEYTLNSNYKVIANANPFRYRSYYYDTETNLYYLNTRYYDPETGRFINADDLSVLDNSKSEYNGLNLYAYCFNNPVNDRDENGNWSWKKFWKTLLVVVVAVVVVTAVAVATVATGGSAGVVLAGAFIGMTTSGITSAISQTAGGGKFDFAQFVIDVSFGAVIGSFSGSPLGKLGVMFGNAVAGFGSSVASDWVQGEKINVKKAVISAGANFALSSLGGAGAQNGLTSHTRQLMTSRSNIISNIKAGNYSSQGAAGAKTLINMHIKNARNVVRALGMHNLIFGFPGSIVSGELHAILNQLING